MQPSNHSTIQPARRRKLLRILLFLAFCVITAIALFYTIENWRGKQAIDRLHRDVAAKGETLDFSALVPPPVAAQENFADTELVRQWFAGRGKPAAFTNLWPELHSLATKHLPSDDKSKAAKRAIDDAGAVSGRKLTDFVAWERAFAAVRSGQTGRVTGAGTNDPPAAREAAARSVLQTLEIYEPALTEFRANTPRPQARYPVKYNQEMPFAIALPHLGQLRNVASAGSLRACAELAAGDSAAALKDTLLLLRLVESLKEEPLLVSQLVRVAMLQTAVQPIWEGIHTHRWTAQQLVELQRALEDIAFLPDLPRALEFERAAGMTTIEMARRQGLGDYLGAVGTEGGPAGNAPLNVIGRLMPRGWFYMEAANYGLLVGEQIQLARKQPLDPLAMGRAVDATDRRLNQVGALRSALIDHNAAARVLLPALGKVSIRFAAGEILARQAAAACAIERYRLAHQRLPETLEELGGGFLREVPFDYFAKKPMTYRRVSDTGYLLYSIGSNGTDEGGKPGKRHFDETADWAW